MQELTNETLTAIANNITVFAMQLTSAPVAEAAQKNIEEGVKFLLKAAEKFADAAQKA